MQHIEYKGCIFATYWIVLQRGGGGEIDGNHRVSIIHRHDYLDL
jgi:hypothetical protein